MSDSNTNEADLHQQSIQLNAGVVASETPTNLAPVQYQIQPNVSIEQPSGNQTAASSSSYMQQQQQQQQYVQQISFPNSMLEQGNIIMPPNVTNFSTNQQSDNNNIPNLPPAIVQQSKSPLSSQTPVIEPLLSPDSDHGEKKPIINCNDVPTNQEHEQKSQQQTSPQKTVVTKVRLSDELNIFDWFRTADIINQIAERAKSSVDSVITALDPGMKEYLYSGGNINIIVISEYDTLVSPIRDVFQTVFGRATVASAKTSSQSAATSFPIKLAHGFDEAIIVARERIKQLRLDTSRVPQNQVMIAVQPSIVHAIDSNSENLHGLKIDENIFTSCYLTYCSVLEDPVLGLTLTSYSQFIPLDADAMSALNMSKLPEGSPYHNLGYITSIDDLMNSRLKIAPLEGLECQWLQQWAGLEIFQVVRDLSSTLAHMYRKKWTDCVS